MRTKKREERTQRQRVAQGFGVAAEREVEHGPRRAAVAGWSLDPVLTVVDQYTRGCIKLLADNTLSGEKVAIALDKALLERRAPESITVDNGTEVTSVFLNSNPHHMRIVQVNILRMSPLRRVQGIIR